MSARMLRFLNIASIGVAALAYRQLLFWSPGEILAPPVEAWLILPTGTPPKLVLALVAAILYRRRRRLREAAGAHGSPALAVLPLLGGFSLFAWGQHVEANELVLVSLVLLVLGASLLRFGTHFTRLLLLPLVVLLFAIPLPAVLTNQLLFSLQLWIARQATALLSLLGFSLFREGNVIYGAGSATMIIDSCSGLRFMEILTLLAVGYVAWFPARPARGALLVAVAPILGYVFNLLRAALLVANPTSELSELHALQGWLVFPGAILCLVLADRLLRHLLPTRESPEARGPAVQALGPTTPKGGPLTLCGLLVIMLGISVWMPRWGPGEVEHPAFIRLPLELEGWRQGRRLPLDQLYLADLDFSTYSHRLFHRADERVSVFVGEDDRRLRRRSLFSPKNAFPRRGWEVSEQSSVVLEPCGTRVERVLAESGGRRMLSYHWYPGSDGLLLETVRAMLATDHSPLARPEPARVIRVAAELGPTPAAPAHTEAELRKLACSLGDARSRPITGEAQPSF